MRLDMATLNFIAEIDAEIQKLGLPVAKVANPANRGNNQEKISNFSRISNAYIEFSPTPDRSICLEEVSRLYRERGWIEIYSSLLDSKIYLVRDSKIKTPDRRILRYAQSELDSLRGLSIDELKVMHEAKKDFGGIISMGKVKA